MANFIPQDCCQRLIFDIQRVNFTKFIHPVDIFEILLEMSAQIPDIL